MEELHQYQSFLPGAVLCLLVCFGNTIVSAYRTWFVFNRHTSPGITRRVVTREALAGFVCNVFTLATGIMSVLMQFEIHDPALCSLEHRLFMGFITMAIAGYCMQISYRLILVERKHEWAEKYIFLLLLPVVTYFASSTLVDSEFIIEGDDCVWRHNFILALVLCLTDICFDIPITLMFGRAVYSKLDFEQRSEEMKVIALLSLYFAIQGELVILVAFMMQASENHEMQKMSITVAAALFSMSPAALSYLKPSRWLFLRLFPAKSSTTSKPLIVISTGDGGHAPNQGGPRDSFGGGSGSSPSASRNGPDLDFEEYDSRRTSTDSSKLPAAGYMPAGIS